MKPPSVLNRPYTRDTVYLIHKWALEGMTVPQIARLLSRSEENVEAALRRPSALPNKGAWRLSSFPATNNRFPDSIRNRSFNLRNSLPSSPTNKGGNALTKREYLQQYQLIQQEIQRLLAEKIRWEELACRVTPVPALRAAQINSPSLLSPALATRFTPSDRVLRARENILPVGAAGSPRRWTRF